MKDINRILLDPIRSRILQCMALRQQITAGELSQLMPDVPKTTLYRHVGLLHDYKLIKVVAEKRIRGSVERTYALDVQTYKDLNTVERTPHNAFGFLMHIYADFHRYFEEDNPNPEQDFLFLSNLNLLLSDTEFKELFGQINTLLREHLANTPNEQRKQRSISFISSPCTTYMDGK